MKMREIADAAGVSLTTVSLVLNGKPGIGDEKRALVTRLLQETATRSVRRTRPNASTPTAIYAFSNTASTPILSTATPASSRRSWMPPERNAAATATIFL